MGDYYDENFEADAPKYVDFSVPQDLRDNADEWFNFDHENGIPVNFDGSSAESEEKMDVSSPDSKLADSSSKVNNGSTPSQSYHMEEVYATPMAVTNPTNTVKRVERSPMITPIPPKQEEQPPDQADERMRHSTDTRAEAPEPAKLAAPPPVKLSNVVTSWSDDENKAEARPSRQTKRAPIKRETRSLARSNSLRRSTRRSAVVESKTKPEAVKKRTSSLDSQHQRRSASQTGAVPAKKTPVRSAVQRRRSQGTTTRMPFASKTGSVGKKITPVGNAVQRRRSLSQSAAIMSYVTRTSAAAKKRTSLVDAAHKRRSASATSTGTPSVAGKRKRASNLIPNQRKSPRLQPPMLTMPHTPNCLRRNKQMSSIQKFKSSEELEMERIEQYQAEAKKALALSRRSYKTAQEPVTYHPTRSAQEPTRPIGFNFKTDTRIKNHGMETRQDADRRDFVGNLRKRPKSPAKHKGPTVKKPFHFSSSNSRKRQHDDSDPMAPQIQEFHRKTPVRFRTKVANDIGAKGHPVKAVHTATKPPTLACPKTPNLLTKTRSRPVTAISAAEREEMEVQEIKNYQFHAQPVDPRVVSNLHFGLQKPSHKSPTKAIGFNLECDKRFREREANKSTEEEEKHEFHAQELNTKMFEGPLGVPPAKSIPLTCPKSPAFALKNRVCTVRTASSPEEKETSRIVHAHPVPHSGMPFVPNLKHKITEAKPFSFDGRDKEMIARKEAKISQILEEEQQNGQFKAQPLPSHDLIKLPEKKVRPVTKPEPFLSVEERATRQAEAWGKKMEEELKEQRQQASSFRATPADVLYHDAFVPKKSDKALTEVSDFELNTDRRAVERAAFEEHKHAQEAELRVAAEERKRIEEEEERQAIQRLRQEMVHKANPIKNFHPVEILPSTRPLTQPESPQFATAARLRSQPRV